MRLLRDISRVIHDRINSFAKKHKWLKKIILSYKNKRFKYHICVINMGESWGANFKEYFIKENMPEKISLLKNGLDEKSVELVDRKIDHFLNFPLQNKYSQYFRSNRWDISLTEEEIEEYKKFDVNYSKIMGKYKGHFNFTLQETFYFHHGLKLLPESVHSYIKDKDFIDLGAFKGDSSVVFSEYSPSIVYAFEIITSYEKIYYSNLKANNIDISKYKFINKGVSNINSRIKFGNVVANNGSLSIGNKLDNSNHNEKNETFEVFEIELVKLDDYFKDNKNIGLIKMDIEGAEYDAILDLENIIKNQTPVMLISIYHTPKEFFELKPLIENINSNYKFMVRNLRLDGVPSMETALICIPKFLEADFY